MRILLVNKFAHVTGGADRHCLDLAEALRTAGHEVKLLSTASTENLESDGEFVPSSVSHLSREGLPAREQARIAAAAFWNPAAAAAMRRLVARFRPHVVHTHKLYPQLSVAPLVVARRRKVPVVQTLHDYEFLSASATDSSGRWVDRAEEKLSFRLLNSLTYPIRMSVHTRGVNAWIAISRFIASSYLHRGLATVTLPNFCRAPADWNGGGSFADRAGVVFIGRLTPEKGVEDVVEVARSLKAISISVAGDGRLRGYVDQASQDLPNLTYLGHRTPADTSSLMSAARVVLLPSRWEEPGGLVALEAMALGTPVVCYARGGLAEYVSDAGGGRIVEQSAEALASACAQLYGDADLWTRMSESGREAIARNHSPEAYLDRLVPVYERVRRSHGPSYV